MSIALAVEAGLKGVSTSMLIDLSMFSSAAAAAALTAGAAAPLPCKIIAGDRFSLDTTWSTSDESPKPESIPTCRKILKYCHMI